MKQPQIHNDLRIEKYFLRKAFEDMLPPEIIWRRKEAFSDGVGGLSKHGIVGYKNILIQIILIITYYHKMEM